MMKRLTVVMIILLSGLLAACGSVNSESVAAVEESEIGLEHTEESVSGSAGSGLTASHASENIYELLGPGCYYRNYFYDIRPYLLYEDDDKTYDETVTSEEFTAYTEDKLDSIDYSDDICAGGLYQTYGFEIVKRDEFRAWETDNGIVGHAYNRDGSWMVYVEEAWEEHGYESKPIGTYKDPSGKYIVLTNCFDYKVIYEFFNGEYEPKGSEESDVLINNPNNSNAQRMINAFSNVFDIEPPFVMSPLISYDLDNDGDGELVGTISGDCGFYSSYILIYDPYTGEKWAICNPDLAYSAELVDDRLLVHSEMNESCKDYNNPDLRSRTGIIVINGLMISIEYE